jgi:inosine-uridine nucleoside N-ribohydrolase
VALGPTEVANVGGMTARKILIDTDPGVDDAMAIFYALVSPELDVVGLTTIFGNHQVDVCTQNALRLLEIAGRSDIPVARGASRPLAMDLRPVADFVHGEDGQGNVFLPPPAGRAVPASAPQFIIDTVMAAPGEITLVPIGPLTNIAIALLLEPRLAENLAGIVLMGGAAFVGGNVSPAAEANVVNDPEAADIVFGADCPLVMLGLDVTEKTLMSNAQLDRFRASDRPMARHIGRIVTFYSDFYRDRLGLDGIHVHDSSTISYLLNPAWYETVSLPIRVDCGWGVSRGKTLPAHRVADEESLWHGRRPVTICTTADYDTLIDHEITRVAG